MHCTKNMLSNFRDLSNAQNSGNWKSLKNQISDLNIFDSTHKFPLFPVIQNNVKIFPNTS
jgi:hypothetical protein